MCPMIFCGVASALLGEDRKPGVACSRFFAGGSVVSDVGRLLLVFRIHRRQGIFWFSVFSTYSTPATLLGCGGVVFRFGCSERMRK